MIRALAWKEYREQRSIVLVGLGLAVVMPFFVLAGGLAFTSGMSMRHLVDAMPMLCAGLLWPLAALAAGAGPFANEHGDRTLGFLVSRPVSRAWVWCTKVTLAGLATLLVIAGSMLLIGFLQTFVTRPLEADVAIESVVSLVDQPFRAAFGPAAIYLLFAAAVFCSTRSVRAVRAAAGAALATIGMSTAFVGFWPWLELQRDFYEPWVTGMTVVAATLMLVASFRRFTAHDTLTPTTANRTGLMLLGITAVTLLLGTAPVLYADRFGDLDGEDLRAVEFDDQGRLIVIAAASYPSTLGSLWQLDPTRHDAKRLTGVQAFQPFVAPDGRHIYYFSRRGMFGLPKPGVDLRVIDVDSGDDTIVVAGIESPSDEFTRYALTRRYDGRRPRFSPDGRSIAWPAGWWGYYPMVVSLDDGAVHFVDIDGALETVWGWTAEGGELVVHTNRREGLLRTLGIVRYDPATGRTTPVFELEGREARLTRSSGAAAAAEAFNVLPITFHSVAMPAGASVFGLLDLGSGDVAEIAQTTACDFPFTNVSANGRTLAYIRYRRCEEVVDEDGDPDILRYEPELHVVDLETGAPRAPVDIDLFANDIVEFSMLRPTTRVRRNTVPIVQPRVSPDGSRILVANARSNHARQIVVVEADGTVLVHDREGLFLDGRPGHSRYFYFDTAWVGNDHFAMVGRYSGPIKVVDVQSGAPVVRYDTDYYR